MAMFRGEGKTFFVPVVPGDAPWWRCVASAQETARPPGAPVPALTNMAWPSRNVSVGITMILFVAG
jgi:hypothetical protein